MIMKLLGTAIIWTLCAALYMGVGMKEVTITNLAIVLGPLIAVALFGIWF